MYVYMNICIQGFTENDRCTSLWMFRVLSNWIKPHWSLTALQQPCQSCIKRRIDLRPCIYVFWCVNDSRSPNILQSVQQIASAARERLLLERDLCLCLQKDRVIDKKVSLHRNCFRNVVRHLMTATLVTTAATLSFGGTPTVKVTTTKSQCLKTLQKWLLAENKRKKEWK